MKTPNPQCDTCVNHDRSAFCDLTGPHLSELESAKTANIYKSHQIIFYEGNQPYGVYCITSGKVKVYKMDVDGNQQIVRLAGPGDLLGYRCLLSNESYMATAETIEEASICFVDRKTFIHILETHPKTAFHVMSVLANDLRHAESQMTNFVHKNVRERLAELFLLLQSKYGEKTATGTKLNIYLSREEMAEIIGTTQESVIRLISEFKQDKLICVSGREITLCNLSRLAETANLTD